MPSLNLPADDRRVVLRSFWLIISIVFGIGFWLICWLLKLAYAPVLAMVATFGIGLLVFWREQSVRRFYHGWNNKVARRLNRLVREAAMRICFFVILTVPGRFGSRMHLLSSIESLWKNRTDSQKDTYLFPYRSGEMRIAKRGWVRGYLGWAVQSNNIWAVSLLPFLCLVKLLSEDEESAAQGNIYTLF